MDTEPVDGPLSPALEAAARGHTLVVGARAPVALFDFALTRPAAGSKLAPELAPAMAQLRQAEATIVTLDLLPPAPDCPLPGADIEARVRFATDGKAAAALPALRDALRWIGRPDPRPATAGSEVLLVAVLKAAREAEVRQEGAEVVAVGGPRWSAADLTASAKTPVRTTEWKLKQIGLALHSYEATHGHFPSAVTRDSAGKPLFSWRVELLPFLEQEQLYFKLNRKEAWNHPDNKTLLEKVPDIYAMSSDDPAKTASGTRFVAVVGKGGVFDETTTTKLPDITDGTSNTLMVVEASEPVHWAEPRDLAYTAGGPVPILGIPTADVFWILLADGSPHTLVRGNVRPADFKGLFTRSGNELVDLEKLKRVRKGK